MRGRWDAELGASLRSIAATAPELGVGERQTQRQYRAHVGLSPAQARRLQRMNAAVYALRDPNAPTRSLADLARHRLLHVERRGLTWVDWPVWLREMDVGVPARLRGPIFNNYVIMIEAAIDGQGIGLGWHGLLDDFLASGQLVKPVQGELRTGRGYYLVRRQSARRNEIVDSFCQWIVESAKPT